MSCKPERPSREQEQPEDIMASDDDMGLSPLEMEMFLLQEEEGAGELQDDTLSAPSHSILRALATDLAAPRVVAEAVDTVAAAVAHALSVLKTTKSLESLAKVLAARYSMTVTLRAGLGTRSVAACTSQLRHRFLMVQLHPGGPPVFVDPTFREQFRLGTSLPSYEAMLNASVPVVFVGSRAALDATVLAICYKMQRALKKLHLEVPPWRAASAVISKWSPARYADTLYHPAPGGGLFGGSGRQPRNGDVQPVSSCKAASGVASEPGSAAVAVLAGPPAFHGRPSASLLSEAFRVIPPRQAEAAAAAAVKNDAAPKSVVYGFSVTRPAGSKPTAAPSLATQAPSTPATVPAPAASTAHALPSARSPPAAAGEEAVAATADADARQGADQSKPGGAAGPGQFRTLEDLLPVIRTIKLGA